MSEINLRKWMYFTLVSLRGQALGAHYKRFLFEDQSGIPPDTTNRLLVRLLAHCKHAVPYYANIMRSLGDSLFTKTDEYLQHFPILTKDIIRARFDELRSTDLPRRKWYFNWSSGSTGEPITLIQDWDYAARSGAITLLFSRLLGREIGEREVRLWGSVQDIVQSSEEKRAWLINRITNTSYLNAFHMKPKQMDEFIHILNTKRPKLIVAYVEAIDELARFAERMGIVVSPQTAIMTSAGTLYPFIREKVEHVFQCRVFNRYGSREVGDIACERPGLEGLWVAPWGNYIEVVDQNGDRVADGTVGELLITSLTNYAMPLIRYKIGDRGVLSPARHRDQEKYGQILEDVLGRTTDCFRCKDGNVAYGGYFGSLVYSKHWIAKYQVIQKSTSSVVYRIAGTGDKVPQTEVEEIAAKTRLVMGDDCKVAFELVDDIAPGDSGKFRHIISEVDAP